MRDQLEGEVAGEVEGSGHVVKQPRVMLFPPLGRHDGRDDETDGIAPAALLDRQGEPAEGGQPRGDGGCAVVESLRERFGVDAGTASGVPAVGEAEERVDAVELRDPAEAGVGAGAEVADALGQAPGQVLDSQGVGVATDLEGLRVADLLVAAGVLQDAREVGEDPDSGRPGQAPGEVAVLAVRGAAFGEVELPVGRGEGWAGA